MSLTRSHSLVLLLAVALLVAMPFMGLLKTTSQASAYSGITVEFDHPAFAGTSEKVPITITIRGGPAGDIGGNYSYKEMNIIAKNSTGWNPDPATQTSEGGVFRLNVTMPAEAGQTVRIYLNATSKEWKTGNETYTNASFQIKVVEPIVINALVYNRGVVDAVNATARFYADGLLIHTQAFNLTAGSSTNLSYNWTFARISSGKHVILVTVDDPSNLIEFSDGNNVFSQTIYVGNQGNPAGGILTVGLIVASVFFVLTYLQKPVKRGKKH